MKTFFNRKLIQGKPRAGFTLVELLVTISVIALLAAIIIPSVTVAFRRAKETRAMRQIKDLESAVKRFYDEYGYMPYDKGFDNAEGKETAILAGDEDKLVILLKVLTGHVKGIALNPKQISFLELDPRDFTKQNISMTAVFDQDLAVAYNDPWGHSYVVLLDMNEDNKVTDDEGKPIYAKVGVLSYGPPPPDPNKEVKMKDTKLKSWR